MSFDILQIRLKKGNYKKGKKKRTPISAADDRKETGNQIKVQYKLEICKSTKGMADLRLSAEGAGFGGVEKSE